MTGAFSPCLRKIVLADRNSDRGKMIEPPGRKYVKYVSLRPLNRKVDRAEASRGSASAYPQGRPDRGAAASANDRRTHVENG